MEIPKQLHKEITEYCKLNSIKDVNKFIIKTLTTGFTIAKYGMQPMGNIKEDTISKNDITNIVPEIKENKETKSKPKKNDLYGED